MSPQPGSTKLTHSRTGAAKRRPLTLVSLRRINFVTVVTRLSPGGQNLIQAESALALSFCLSMDHFGKPLSSVRIVL